VKALLYGRHQSGYEEDELSGLPTRNLLIPVFGAQSCIAEAVHDFLMFRGEQSHRGGAARARTYVHDASSFRIEEIGGLVQVAAHNVE